MPRLPANVTAVNKNLGKFGFWWEFLTKWESDFHSCTRAFFGFPSSQIARSPYAVDQRDKLHLLRD